MDYKYIEQLLERFWECQTSPEEEQILRDFFKQEEVPAELAQYKPLFDFERSERNIRLGSDFDQRVLSRVAEEQPVVAKRISFTRRLRPLYQAAASIAVVLMLGTAAQHSFHESQKTPVWDYNTTSYKDTYKDPQVAYNVTMDALKSVSDAFRDVQPDSAKQAKDGVDNLKTKMQ